MLWVWGSQSDLCPFWQQDIECIPLNSWAPQLHPNAYLVHFDVDERYSFSKKKGTLCLPQLLPKCSKHFRLPGVQTSIMSSIPCWLVLREDVCPPHSAMYFVFVFFVHQPSRFEHSYSWMKCYYPCVTFIEKRAERWCILTGNLTEASITWSWYPQ